MKWVCMVGDDTTIVVVLEVLTQKNDEKTTRIMVPTEEEMNCM